MAQVLECPQVEQPPQTSPVSNAQKKKQTPHSSPVTGKQVLLLAAWFGLMTGLVESLAYALDRYVMGNFIFFGDSIFYVTPLVQAIVAMIICLPLALIAMRRRKCSEHLVVSLLVFLSTYNTAMLIPNLHYLAELMLALGVAAQVGRWVEKNPGSLARMNRSSLVIPGMAVLLIIVITKLFPALQEQRALANLPVTQKTPPNVLLVVLDTVRSDALDLKSTASTSRTPNLRRLGEEGFVFQQAHATCPWTLPSHASMFTSRLPHELSSGWYSGMNDQFPTIAEWLQDLGYKTGGFVGNTIYCSRETGLDRGFIHYEDYVLSLEQIMLSTAWGRQLASETLLPLRLGCYDTLARRRASGIRQNLARWLDTSDDDHPFFLMVNFYDAHHPYVPPPPFQSSPPPNMEEREELRYWWNSDKEYLSEEQIATQRKGYESCITHLDSQVGLLLSELRRRGALENTLVIITADHGEHFGDHNLYGHGNSLYEASIHVPMIVWSSDLQLQGRQSDTIVSTRDLPATIAEYVAPEVSHPFAGRSLLRHFRPKDGGYDEDVPIFSQISAPSRFPACGGNSPVFRGPMKCVLFRGLKYIRNGDGIEEVYDVVNDSQELEDLSKSLHEKLLQELRDLIDQQISS